MNYAYGSGQPRAIYFAQQFVKYNYVTFSFLLFGLVAIIANYPYFISGRYPIHDTLAVYQFFNHFYSELLYSKEIPLWLPYSAYGMPIDTYFLFSLGPFQYLSLALAYILKLKSTLPVFAFSLLLESMFLMFSTFIFLKHNLTSKIAIITSVCFVGLLAQYDIQLYWNFKILLPMPLCLYCVQRWSETLNPVLLLACMTNLLIWSFGALPYVIPFQFYVIVCYCCMLNVNGKHLHDINLKNMRGVIVKNLQQLQQRINILLSIPLLIMLGLSIKFIFQIKQVIETQLQYSTIAGRNPDLTVAVSSYMNHGGFTSWHKIMEMLNGMPIFKHELLPFTGIVCISLAIYGLFSKNKSKSHIALLISTLFIIAFSIGTTRVARIVYYLPQMNLFRHIAYVIAIGKLFLIMLAGFGIDAYINKKQQN